MRSVRLVSASAARTSPVSRRPRSTVSTRLLTLRASALSSASGKLSSTRREKSPSMALSTTAPNERCNCCIISTRSLRRRSRPSRSSSLMSRTLTALSRNTSTARAMAPTSSWRLPPATTTARSPAASLSMAPVSRLIGREMLRENSQPSSAAATSTPTAISRMRLRICTSGASASVWPIIDTSAQLLAPKFTRATADSIGMSRKLFSAVAILIRRPERCFRRPGSHSSSAARRCPC